MKKRSKKNIKVFEENPINRIQKGNPIIKAVKKIKKKVLGGR